MILEQILYALSKGSKIHSFLIAFVVEMAKLIWLFHGRTFGGQTFSGQDVSFPDISGPDKSVTGRFVGLLMKILPHMPYELR